MNTPLINDFFIDKIVKIRLNIASPLDGRGTFQHIFNAHLGDGVPSELPPTKPRWSMKVSARIEKKNLPTHIIPTFHPSLLKNISAPKIIFNKI